MPAIVHSISTSEAGGRARHELAAMRAIATAIEDLPNDQARFRVLRWVTEVFGLNLTLGQAGTEPVSSPAPQPDNRHDDASLAVDGIDALFESPARTEPVTSPAPQPDDRHDDASLAVDGIDVLFESPAGTRRLEPARATTDAPWSRAQWKDELPDEFEGRPHGVPTGTGVASSLEGFVADFQRLAKEWRE